MNKSDLIETYAMDLFSRPCKDLGKEENDRLMSYVYDIEHPRVMPVRFEGVIDGYMITNVGDVFAKRRGRCSSPDGILQKKYSNLGTYVSLRRNDSRYTKIAYIHDLVANAFLSNPNGYEFVIHKNGNTKCNWIRNLVWSDSKEVHVDPIPEFHKRKDVVPNPTRDPNLISWKTIDAICSMLEDDKLSISEIARIAEVDRKIVSRIADTGKYLGIMES